MQAQLRRLSDIDARTEAAWTELAARAVEPNPFFEPLFVRPLARHLGLDVAVLTVEHGTDMVVCLPLLRGTLQWHGLPLDAWRGMWNPLTTPLADIEGADAALASAIAQFSSLGGPRLLVLDYLTADGPVAAALGAATAGRSQLWPSKFKESTRPVLHRRDDGSYFATTLVGKHKRKLAWARRALERELGDSLTVVDEGGHGDAVERLLAIEVSGWKGRIGSAVESRADHAAYFRDICARFADHGRLQILSLRGAGTTVASKCDIRAGGMTFGFRTAFDERFAKASPGVQLEIDAVTVFHASGDVFADSCTNHVDNPQAWLWPDRRRLTRFIVALDRTMIRQ